MASSALAPPGPPRSHGPSLCCLRGPPAQRGAVGGRGRLARRQGQRRPGALDLPASRRWLCSCVGCLGARVQGTKSGGKMVQLCFLSWISRWKMPFGKCPSPPSCSGDTPLDDARSQGHDNVVKLLESAVPGLHLKCAKDAQNSVVSHRFLCIKTRTCTGEAEPTNDALLHPARSNQHII